MRKTILQILVFLLGIGCVQAQNNHPQNDIKKDFVSSINTSGVSSKKGSRLKKEADRTFNNFGYMDATQKYQQLDATEQSSRETMRRIATSYSLNDHPEEAEYWYTQFVDHSSNSKDFLHFAQALQSNGKCEKAVEYYNKYKKSVDKSELQHRNFIQNCNELELLSNEENVIVKNIEELNSKALDFSPIPYKDGVVFTSTRGINRISKNLDKWTNGNFSDLFYAQSFENGKFNKIETLKGKVNGRFHDGAVTFNEGGSIMVFTRNNTSKKTKSDHINLKLYMAYNNNDYWSDVKELSFNGDNFTTCHPSLSSDGTRLYFVSDRPGGYGGTDIYVSHLENGNWTSPKNLGPDVNTAGNEVFPFFSKSEVLYFSSNGHTGFGGLDLFMAKKQNESDDISWGTIKNMGKPFNSLKDDFGFYTNESGSNGFLSSSRKGGLGGDDIYSWKIINDKSNIENTFKSVIVSVVNDKDNSIISGLDLTINEVKKGAPAKPMKFSSDKNGHVIFVVKDGANYIFNINAEGYIPFEKIVPTEELHKGIQFKLSANERNCMTLDGVVLNEKYNKPLAGATVTILNKCSGDESTLISNDEGEFDLCLECGCEYFVTATKSKFSKDQIAFSTIRPECTDMSLPKQVEKVKLNIQMDETGFVLEKRPPAEVELIAKKKAIKKYFLDDPNSSFKKGQLIVLKDIHYNYDRHEIRSDAEMPLFKIVELMKLYPSMKIQLSSHTDSRGSSQYNENLSVQRAYSAMQFIISKGISKDRLNSTGFGENKLINQCRDGVKCSEKEHQENRRTEIRVIEFSENDVEIIYNN